MDLRKYVQYAIECDECHYVEAELYDTLGEAMKGFRADGWEIGQRTLCPKCSGNEPEEEEDAE